MKKRMLAIVLTVTLMLGVSAYRVGSITLGLTKAVSMSSGSYTLTVATPRGIIYDCNMTKITIDFFFLKKRTAYSCNCTARNKGYSPSIS